VLPVRSRRPRPGFELLERATVESTSCIATLSVISSARLPGSSGFRKIGLRPPRAGILELAQRGSRLSSEEDRSETLLPLARHNGGMLPAAQHRRTGGIYASARGRTLGSIVPRSKVLPAQGFNPDDTGDFQENHRLVVDPELVAFDGLRARSLPSTPEPCSYMTGSNTRYPPRPSSSVAHGTWRRRRPQQVLPRCGAGISGGDADAGLDETPDPPGPNGSR